MPAAGTCGGRRGISASGFRRRAATAVFRLKDSQWETDGRALFNLSPTQAIEHFQHELDTVD